jgi:hypothetical protein
MIIFSKIINQIKLKGKNMKAKLVILILISVFIVSIISVGLVSAQSNNAGQNGNQAIPNRPTDLEQVIFVHKVKPDKPENPGDSKGKPTRDTASYKLWGGKLLATAQYKINTTNINGDVSPANAAAAVQAAAESWNLVTYAPVNSEEADILYYSGTTNNSGYSLDGENTVSWGELDNDGIIAVAYYWYSRRTKEVVEFDIVFNNYFTWNTNGSSYDMDIQNLATHEFGHPIGLSDLYTGSATELTMYGYSTEGETKKQTLELGDIAGAQSIYGAEPQP